MLGGCQIADSWMGCYTITGSQCPEYASNSLKTYQEKENKNKTLASNLCNCIGYKKSLFLEENDTLSASGLPRSLLHFYACQASKDETAASVGIQYHFSPSIYL